MDFKDCPIYIKGRAKEGTLFRCDKDPETEIAYKNGYSGCWCIPRFSDIIKCPLDKKDNDK